MAGKIETRVEKVEFHKDRKEFQKQLERNINYWFCEGWEFKALIPGSSGELGHVWVVYCKERKKEGLVRP